MLNLFNLPEMGLIDLDKINSIFMLLSIIKYPAVWLGLFQCLSSSVQHFLFTTLCGALGPDHAGGA